MKKFLLGLTALFALSTAVPAFAADEPVADKKEAKPAKKKKAKPAAPAKEEAKKDKEEAKKDANK